jgi:cytoskeletal protein CcmA (bactofilin family)
MRTEHRKVLPIVSVSTHPGGEIVNSNACPRPGAPLLGLLIVTMALFGCDESGDASSRVNGSVHVPAGRAAGPADTVNGGIDIDANAAVSSATTVNGHIALGAGATADSLTTVNGDINVGAGAHVSGKLDSVNGGIILGDGALVGGSLENVNGGIRLSAARVDGGITTVNGNIDIRGNSHVDAGIYVQKVDHGLIHFDTSVPRIVIGPGATVSGELRFEREVKLYVSDRATVGAVTGATAISFSGDSPPN